jgi:hypothetical protein
MQGELMQGARTAPETKARPDPAGLCVSSISSIAMAVLIMRK